MLFRSRLFQTFDLAIFWNKTGSQATVHAEITENTLHAVQAILDPTQDGYHDTDPNPGQHEPIGHLTNTPRLRRLPQPGQSSLRFTGTTGQMVRTANRTAARGQRNGVTGDQADATRPARPGRPIFVVRRW